MLQSWTSRTVANISLPHPVFWGEGGIYIFSFAAFIRAPFFPVSGSARGAAWSLVMYTPSRRSALLCLRQVTKSRSALRQRQGQSRIAFAKVPLLASTVPAQNG